MNGRLALTKKRVMIETTNYINGCLEQGGVCGRIDSYDIGEVAKLLDVDIDELEFMEEEEFYSGSYISARAAIQYRLEGRCVRSGIVIE